MKYIYLSLIVTMLASSSIASGQGQAGQVITASLDPSCLSINVETAAVNWGNIDSPITSTITKRFPESGDTSVTVTRGDCGPGSNRWQLSLLNDGGGYMHNGTQKLHNPMHISYRVMGTPPQPYTERDLSSNQLNFGNPSAAASRTWSIHYTQNFVSGDLDGEYQLILTYSVSLV